jgi:hypothetical protein
MMRTVLLLQVGIIMLLTNCKINKYESINSPLATVIKLNAAESLMNFDEARKYQDVDKIYGKDTGGDKLSAEDVWKEKLEFFYNLGKDKKFTNQWKYFDYDIVEKITNNTAEVILKSKDQEANLQEIRYKLEMRQGSWIVVDIDFKKK